MTMEICKTTVKEDQNGAALVSITIADADDPAIATEYVSFSVLITPTHSQPFLTELQFEAFDRAIEIIRKHTRALQPKIEQGRR